MVGRGDYSDFPVLNPAGPASGCSESFRTIQSNALIGRSNRTNLHSQKSPLKAGFLINNGGPWAIRTPDQLIKSQLLYQLS